KNLVVNGELILRNVTLIFNSSSEKFGIEVKKNAALYVYDSTIKAEDGEYYFKVEGKLFMKNSKIIDCKTSLHPLLVFGSIVATDGDITLTNCEFSHSGYVTLYDSNATISSCYFHDSVMGIKTSNSNVTISGCIFDVPIHGGTVPIDVIRGYKGHLAISDCIITNNVKIMPGHSISLGKMDAEIKNCKIIQNATNLKDESAAIYIGSGNYSLEDIEINYHYALSSTYDLTSLYPYAIHAKNAEVSVKGGRITGARYGLYAEECKIDMENVRIENNSWGVYAISPDMKIERCDIINNKQGSIVLKGTGENISIQYCNIYGNGGFIKDCDAIVDAKLNYWGSSDGPHVKRNEEVIHSSDGDRIYILKGTLIYEPWLTEKVSNTTNFTKPNVSIKLPLLTIWGSTAPRVEPGRKSQQKMFLENDGEKDAVFLLAILTPYYINIDKIEGGEIIASSPEVKLVKVYLKPKQYLYLTIYFTVPPDMAFGENPKVKFNSTYLPCIVAEFASLPLEKWNELKAKYDNVDELLNEAWNISRQAEKNFFNNFTKLDYEKQVETLLDLYKVNPILSNYIAWSVIYDTFNEKMYGEKVKSSRASFLMDVSAAPTQNDYPAEGGIWEKTKWYAKEFFNEEFLPTAWEGLKGLGAGALNAATLGIVDIKAKNEYMQAGKVIGEIAGNIEMALITSAAAGAVARKAGLESVHLFSRMEGTQFRTLIGLEARYSNGVYGNIIKIAENPRFGGWYLGIGHYTTRTIELAAEGKTIYPGWFHYYFATGKIATWVPTAAQYAEYNLYSMMWNAAKFGAAALLAGSLVGGGASQFEVVRSIDPNSIDVSPSKYVTNVTEDIIYTIHFENLENATAPAHDVRVIVPLDENINASSIKLISSSHPEKLKYFNVSDGMVEIVFKNITLPPNKEPPEGEGWVSFKANLKDDVKAGDEIKEKAKVYFDYNPPVETNEVVLMFDATPPSTEAKAHFKDGKIYVTATGSDEGSGINYTTITVFEKGSRKFRHVTVPLKESIAFGTSAGKTYYIYSNGIDNAGNIEIKGVADTVITTPSSMLPYLIIAIIIAAIIAIAIVMARRKE
ncbi:MAG: right-handed parallel beta-helix repeat-containing protein, partial [Thermoplasmata archaeon]